MDFEVTLLGHGGIVSLSWSQVAAVLRQSGTHVRLVVARPVEPTSPDYKALGSHAPIVPTKILGDPEELDRHLVHSVPENYNIHGNTFYDNEIYPQDSELDMHVSIVASHCTLYSSFFTVFTM